MRYYIVQAPNKEMLGVRVSQRILNGWEPIGGLAISPDNKFYQAVVKHDE